jgi:hypothetical protein
MSLSRRTFLAQLAGAFGAASLPDLRARIADRGRPILLAPPASLQTLHVYCGGYLTFGPETLQEPARPTWRAVLRAEGVQVENAAALRAEMRGRWLDPHELDAPVSDVCWPMVYETTWAPAARAARYLRRLDIGPRFTTRPGHAGALAFHEGDNHPGSSEIWVDVADDLSASLLQARLIELGEPVRLVMETDTISRDDEE